MQSKTSLEKANQKLKGSLTFRLFAIAILVLLLLIPTAMVKDMIRERRSFSEEAKREVSQKWGKAQSITGPVLNIPYFEYDKDGEKKTKKIAHFLPEDIQINAEINPKERYRGIYKVIVYESSINASGVFKKLDFKKLGLKKSQLIPEEAFLSIGITDLRGIQEKIRIDWNEQDRSCSPGIPDQGLLNNGVSSEVKLDSAQTAYHFDFNIAINGSQSIYFHPVGKKTQVNMQSSWPTPKFDGNFLPDTRNITDNGFEAEWKILHLNRNYPQQWKEQKFNFSDTDFGVELITQVATYQKSMRTIKYAILIIALTFLIFFFTELRSRKKIHPLQYILVGFALVLFFSLLVSLSEHIKFIYAFLISALSIMLLVGGYSGYIFRSRRTGVQVFVFLGIIYAFIYTILQMESYALLAGNIGLFIILAIIMWVSRKMNMRNTQNKPENPDDTE